MLDADEPLAVGDEVELVDEGQIHYRGDVVSVEPGRYGNEYRIRFSA